MITDRVKWRHIIALVALTTGLFGLIWVTKAEPAGTIEPDRRISCWVSLEPGEPVPDAYRECEIHRASRD